MKRLIGREIGYGGVETQYYWNDADNKLHVVCLQDVEPQLNQNKREYNNHSDYKSTRYGKGPLHKIASIPPGVVEKWLKEGFNVFTASDAELRRKLNSSDNRHLRTMPGRL